MGGTLTEERRSEPGSAGAGGHTDAKISNMRLETGQQLLLLLLLSNFPTLSAPAPLTCPPARPARLCPMRGIHIKPMRSGRASERGGRLFSRP